MAYCTLEQVREYINVKAVGSHTQDDALITRLIAAAQAWIESPIGAGRRFEVADDETRSFYREDVRGKTLYVDEDLAQITSVANGIVINASTYVTEPRRTGPYYGITLRDGSAWDTYTDDAITVTGRWGYSVTPPANIVQACIRLVSWMYRQRDTNAEGDRPLLTGDGVMIIPSRVPHDIWSVMVAYRKVSL